jgi:hypothetical protein
VYVVSLIFEASVSVAVQMITPISSAKAANSTNDHTASQGVLSAAAKTD